MENNFWKWIYQFQNRSSHHMDLLSMSICVLEVVDSTFQKSASRENLTLYLLLKSKYDANQENITIPLMCRSNFCLLHKSLEQCGHISVPFLLTFVPGCVCSTCNLYKSNPTQNSVQDSHFRSSSTLGTCVICRCDFKWPLEA